MFSKTDGKLESLIGTQSEFQGDLNIKGTVRVDGRVKGQVNAECVILSESGLIIGDINAARIVIGGKVEGNVRAREIVEIKSKGKVLGEIFTPKFSITEGGEFNGKIEMKMEEVKVVEFEPKTSERLDLRLRGNRGLY